MPEKCLESYNTGFKAAGVSPQTRYHYVVQSATCHAHVYYGNAHINEVDNSFYTVYDCLRVCVYGNRAEKPGWHITYYILLK